MIQIDEIIQEVEPYMSGEVDVYTAGQIRDMMLEYRKVIGEEQMKQLLIENEEYRIDYLRTLITQLRYCLPFPHPDTPYDEFNRKLGWNQDVSRSTAERMVRLITTGSADKPIKSIGEI